MPRILVAFVLATFISHTAQAGALRTVALTGRPAPGVFGNASFANFGTAAPNINAAGQTTFTGMLQVGGAVTSTNDLGLWSEGSGSLSLVAREGDQAPGLAEGVKYDTFFRPIINSQGEISFGSNLLVGEGGVTGFNNLTLWSNGHGPLTVVAREGSQAPGAEVGEAFRVLNTNSHLFNDAGDVAFVGNVVPNDVPANNFDYGVWRQRNGVLSLLARERQPTSGLPGVTYDGGFGYMTLNGQSQVVFLVGLEGAVGDVNDNNDTAYLTEGPGALVLVGREGDAAPGFGAYDNLDFPYLTPAGKTIFQGGSGIFANQGGVASRLYGINDPAPGVPLANFSGFDSQNLTVNSQGQIQFNGVLAISEESGVTAANNRGIWSEGLGGIHVVVREGSQAPGAPLGANFNSMSNAILNAAGQVAFRATLVTGAGGVTTANNSGLWAEDHTGVLRLIARTGDLVTVAPGDSRTIASLVFQGTSGNNDGRPSGFNDLGQLVFGATFTDGASGIFVSNLVSSAPRFAADFNHDGAVDLEDLSAWRLSAGVDDYADADGDGDSDGADFVVWQRQLGSSVNGPMVATVPEPASATLAALLGLAAVHAVKRRRPRRCAR